VTDAWNEPWPDTTLRWPKPPRRRENRQWYPGRNLAGAEDATGDDVDPTDDAG
jgi:hypothetical protein